MLSAVVHHLQHLWHASVLRIWRVWNDHISRGSRQSALSQQEGVGVCQWELVVYFITFLLQRYWSVKIFLWVMLGDLLVRVSFPIFAWLFRNLTRG